MSMVSDSTFRITFGVPLNGNTYLPLTNSISRGISPSIFSLIALSIEHLLTRVLNRVCFCLKNINSLGFFAKKTDSLNKP